VLPVRCSVFLYHTLYLTHIEMTFYGTVPPLCDLAGNHCVGNAARPGSDSSRTICIRACGVKKIKVQNTPDLLNKRGIRSDRRGSPVHNVFNVSAIARRYRTLSFLHLSVDAMYTQ
jgi:hypothetical protein